MHLDMISKNKDGLEKGRGLRVKKRLLKTYSPAGDGVFSSVFFGKRIE